MIPSLRAWHSSASLHVKDLLLTLFAFNYRSCTRAHFVFSASNAAPLAYPSPAGIPRKFWEPRGRAGDWNDCSFLSSSSPSPHSCVPIYLCEAPTVCPHEWLPESPADTRPPRKPRRSEALILQLVSKRKQELLKFQIVRAARSIFTGRVYYVTVVKMFNSRIGEAALFNKNILIFFL